MLCPEWAFPRATAYVAWLFQRTITSLQHRTPASAAIIAVRLGRQGRQRIAMASTDFARLCNARVSGPQVILPTSTAVPALHLLLPSPLVVRERLTYRTFFLSPSWSRRRDPGSRLCVPLPVQD